LKDVNTIFKSGGHIVHRSPLMQERCPPNGGCVWEENSFKKCEKCSIVLNLRTTCRWTYFIRLSLRRWQPWCRQFFSCSVSLVLHALSRLIVVLFRSHVVSWLKHCSQRIYLLKMLRSQSVPPAKLHIIFKAIVVSRILYALPAWGTHLLSSQSGRIDAFFKRAYRYGLAGELFTVDDLLYSSGTGLFKKMRHSTHCLNHLLTPIKSMDYVLCNSGQSYILPHCNYQFHKNSFINWCLFS